MFVGFEATSLGVLAAGNVPTARHECLVAGSDRSIVFLLQLLGLAFFFGLLRGLILLCGNGHELVLGVALFGLDAACLGVFRGGLVPVLGFEGGIGQGNGRLVFLL